jgi:hypothetical protein
MKQSPREQTFVNFVRPFHPFDAQEDERRNQRDIKVQEHGLLITNPRIVNTQCHRQRTAKQNDRVDTTQTPIQELGTGVEDLRKTFMINHVRDKRTTEHQDLSAEEQPNTKFTGGVFFLRILIVMRGVMVVFGG